MCRGAISPADWPKFVLVIRFAKLAPVALLGSLKLGWLNALNTSNRNWKLTRSVTLMFLNKDWSVTKRPGPTNVLRARFPLQARHGVVNKQPEPFAPNRHGAGAVPALNQPFIHCALVALKLFIAPSGRSLRVPSLLKSQREPVAQYGVK